jgi:glutamine amidotransferase
MKIAIVDYGAGNTGSVSRALSFIGAKTELVTDASGLENADAVVLPGVGSFSCARKLEPIRKGLLKAMEEKPFLGICLGLQLLFESSGEAKGRGLGIYQGEVERLKCKKVPHMGWNTVIMQEESRLLEGVESQPFYFCHSYAVKECPDAVAYCNEESERFVAAVEMGNLFAVQFHPEKSGPAGLEVLRNFVGVVRK